MGSERGGPAGKSDAGDTTGRSGAGAVGARDDVDDARAGDAGGRRDGRDADTDRGGNASGAGASGEDDCGGDTSGEDDCGGDTGETNDVAGVAIASASAPENGTPVGSDAVTPGWASAPSRVSIGACVRALAASCAWACA
jgi:hypothetical protein